MWLPFLFMTYTHERTDIPTQPSVIIDEDVRKVFELCFMPPSPSLLPQAIVREDELLSRLEMLENQLQVYSRVRWLMRM